MNMKSLRANIRRFDRTQFVDGSWQNQFRRNIIWKLFEIILSPSNSWVNINCILWTATSHHTIDENVSIFQHMKLSTSFELCCIFVCNGETEFNWFESWLWQYSSRCANKCLFNYSASMIAMAIFRHSLDNTCNFIVKSFEKPIFAHETSHSDIVEWFLLGVALNPSQTLCMPFKSQQTRQLKCVKYTICNGKQWDENAPNNVVVETKLPWREMWNGQASK